MPRSGESSPCSTRSRYRCGSAVLWRRRYPVHSPVGTPAPPSGSPAGLTASPCSGRRLNRKATRSAANLSIGSVSSEAADGTLLGARNDLAQPVRTRR